MGKCIVCGRAGHHLGGHWHLCVQHEEDLIEEKEVFKNE